MGWQKCFGLCYNAGIAQSERGGVTDLSVPVDGQRGSPTWGEALALCFVATGRQVPEDVVTAILDFFGFINEAPEQSREATKDMNAKTLADYLADLPDVKKNQEDFRRRKVQLALAMSRARNEFMKRIDLD